MMMQHNDYQRGFAFAKDFARRHGLGGDDRYRLMKAVVDSLMQADDAQRIGDHEVYLRSRWDRWTDDWAWGVLDRPWDASDHPGRETDPEGPGLFNQGA